MARIQNEDGTEVLVFDLAELQHHALEHTTVLLQDPENMPPAVRNHHESMAQIFTNLALVEATRLNTIATVFETMRNHNITDQLDILGMGPVAIRLNPDIEDVPEDGDGDDPGMDGDGS